MSKNSKNAYSKYLEDETIRINKAFSVIQRHMEAPFVFNLRNAF